MLLYNNSGNPEPKPFAYPSRMLQIQGNPSKKCDITATAEASAREGKIASLITIPPSLFRAVGSSPRPARIRIITNAIILRKNYYTIRTENEINNIHPSSVHATSTGTRREGQQVRTQSFSFGGGADPEAIYNLCLILKIML
jgi:hypothetical protein